MNKVMLIGNVGRDPEVRYFDNNSKKASFTLATSERYKDRSGEQKERTEWHSIVAWRAMADLAENFIRKGNNIFIEGRLTSRDYTDANGVKKTITEVEATNIQLLGKREGPVAPLQQGAPQQAYQQPAQPAFQQPAYQQPAYQAPVQEGPADDGNDLPF